jgi:hypothetical protein
MENGWVNEPGVIIGSKTAKLHAITNHNTKTMIISIRGTIGDINLLTNEMSEDWRVNLDKELVKNPWGKGFFFLNFFFFFKFFFKKGFIHNGFKKEVKDMVHIKYFLSNVIRNAKEGYQLVFSGHSQGL